MIWISWQALHSHLHKQNNLIHEKWQPFLNIHEKDFFSNWNLNDSQYKLTFKAFWIPDMSSNSTKSKKTPASCVSVMKLGEQYNLEKQISVY